MVYLTIKSLQVESEGFFLIVFARYVSCVRTVRSPENQK